MAEYTKIDYAYAMMFQTGEACHEAYNGMFVNLSDINRYMVWDEAGLPLCIVDTKEQAEASLILYSWSYLNGRNCTLDSAPCFKTMEQIEYVKDRINFGEVVGLKPRIKSSNITYLEKREDYFKPLSFGEVNKRQLYETIQREHAIGRA